MSSSMEDIDDVEKQRTPLPLGSLSPSVPMSLFDNSGSANTTRPTFTSTAIPMSIEPRAPVQPIPAILPTPATTFASITSSRRKFHFSYVNGQFQVTGRPAWTSSVQADKPGKGNHRRHVISSHLLRQSLCAEANRDQLHIAGNLIKFALEHHITIPSFTDVCALLDVVAQHIHSNPRNLWPGTGPENSAIGFLGHDIRSLSARVKEFANEVPAKYALEGFVAALNRLDAGMFAAIREPLVRQIQIIVAVEVADHSSEQALNAVCRLLDDIGWVALDLDLSQEGAWKEQNAQAIAIQGFLLDFYLNGVGDFWSTMRLFMNLADPRIVVATLLSESPAATATPAITFGLYKPSSDKLGFSK